MKLNKLTLHGPWRYDFAPGQPAEVQLLALALELRQLLRGKDQLTAFIPRAIYAAVPPTTFQELVFDTLSPLYADLPAQLSLRVHDASHFEIHMNTQGKQP